MGRGHLKIMPLNRDRRFAAANRHRQRLVTGDIGGHGMNCGQRIGELDSAAGLSPASIMRTTRAVQPTRKNVEVSEQLDSPQMTWSRE